MRTAERHDPSLVPGRAAGMQKGFSLRQSATEAKQRQASSPRDGTWIERDLLQRNLTGIHFWTAFCLENSELFER
jgi:hypothetical protein